MRKRRCPEFFIRCCHLVKNMDAPKVLVQTVFKERLSKRLDWITSRGPIHSAFLWFKSWITEHPRPLVINSFVSEGWGQNWYRMENRQEISG